MRTRKLLSSVHCTVFELNEGIMQFLGLVLGFHLELHSSQAQGRAATLDCAISIIKDDFPSMIARFLEASPTLLQGQGRRLLVTLKA